MMTYKIIDTTETASGKAIKCLVCGMTSYSPKDVEKLYCGNCKGFHPRPVWGIFDTEDKLWLGNDAGPVLFADQMIARVAAEMADVQLKWKLNRCQAKEFPVGAPVTLRDEQDLHMAAEEALRRLEVGFIP